MSQIDTPEMTTDSSVQVTIRLSPKAHEDFKRIADWKRMPLSSLLRQILEREHESPSFTSLHRRMENETEKEIADD